MPCKTPLGTQRNELSVYRPCIVRSRQSKLDLRVWYLNHYPPMQSHHREGMSPTPVVPALPVSISRNCFGRIPDLIAFTKALSIPRSESLDFAAPDSNVLTCPA